MVDALIFLQKNASLRSTKSRIQEEVESPQALVSKETVLSEKLEELPSLAMLNKEAGDEEGV